MVLETLKMQLIAAVAASDEAKIMSAFIPSLSHLKPFSVLGLKEKETSNLGAVSGRDAYKVGERFIAN